MSDDDRAFIKDVIRYVAVVVLILAGCGSYAGVI